jgi:hypothetical protein
LQGGNLPAERREYDGGQCIRLQNYALDTHLSQTFSLTTSVMLTIQGGN